MANSTGEGKGLSGELICLTCGLSTDLTARDSALRLKLERLITRLRAKAEEDRRVYAENAAKMARGESITVTTFCGPYIPIEEKFADELSTLLTEDSK